MCKNIISTLLEIMLKLKHTDSLRPNFSSKNKTKTHKHPFETADSRETKFLLGFPPPETRSNPTTCEGPKKNQSFSLQGFTFRFSKSLESTEVGRVQVGGGSFLDFFGQTGRDVIFLLG